MFWLLVEKDIRDIVGSPKFVISFGVCASVILLAFYVGAMNYRASRSEYEADVVDNRRQSENLTNWSNLQEYRVFLPPTPISSLVVGVSGDIGRAIKISWEGLSGPYESRFGEAPVLAIFRHLDLEFLFGVLLSLFAILMCYDSVSGEKERGTLRLVFANSVSRSSYLAGKMAGSLLAIGVPLLVAISVGSLILPLLGVVLSAEDWCRLAIMVICGFAYISCFMAMSMLVSSITSRSANSLMILLVVWTISVQLIPRIGVFLAGTLVDVPSVDDLTAQEEKFRSQSYSEYKGKLSSFRPSPNADGAQATKESQQLMEKVLTDNYLRVQELADRLDEDRENKQRLRARVGLLLSRVSPYSSLSLSLSSLAGTDLTMANRFRDQAESFRRDLTAFLREKTGSYGGFGIGTYTASSGKPIDVTELPVFEYSRSSLGEVVLSAAPELGLLLTCGLMAFAAAFVAFGRYDLR